MYPEEYKKRHDDKLRYRYPGVGGESYLDVIERIRPVIIGERKLCISCYTYNIHSCLTQQSVIDSMTWLYIVELERQRRSVVVICHLAVLRYESLIYIIIKNLSIFVKVYSSLFHGS
jgi:broad specificity phosphatase PhoE